MRSAGSTRGGCEAALYAHRCFSEVLTTLAVAVASRFCDGLGG